MPSSREAVARAIYCAARPGHRWFDEPPAVLEYWGGLADAAIAAMVDALGQQETRDIFAEAWEEADRTGRTGSRVTHGLLAVAQLISGRRR